MDDSPKSVFGLLVVITITIGIGCLLQIGCLKVLEHEMQRSSDAIRKGYFE